MARHLRATTDLTMRDVATLLGISPALVARLDTD